ncbi:hypothetical protein [Streptomyces sp. NPDC093970]|uniref:hypothetical protein n=1 Tax=Streptomyces sp. NPDC093970 TaxID=3155076 RepID=UPI00341D2207
MTMNRWTRRVSTAVAATTLVGGAVLGVVGPASAATASGPAEHSRPSAAVLAVDGDRDGRYGDHGRYDYYGDHDHAYGRDGHRGQAEATTWYAVSGERWYLDQVAWATDRY